jgi:hypothetical protein
VDRTKAMLTDFQKEFPELGGRTAELAGFGWHQGWNDRINPKFTDEYETNMAHFIRDVRKDLGVGLALLAERTNLSLGYLSRIELWKNSASAETLYRICLGLSIRMSDLFASIRV